MRIVLNQLQFGCMIDEEDTNDLKTVDHFLTEDNRFLDAADFEYEDWAHVVSFDFFKQPYLVILTNPVKNNIHTFKSL